MHRGFITLHRKFKDWEWYEDVNCKVLFLELLLSVNYEDKKWRGETIKRGSIVTSIAHLSTETTLSPKQVRTALDKLEKSGVLGKRATSKYTLITLVNFNAYQEKGQTKGQTEGKPMANEGQTEGKPMATTKQCNNVTIKQLNNKKIIGANAPKTKVKREKYGDHKNINLSVEEYAELLKEFGDETLKEKIEALSDFKYTKEIKGKSYAWDIAQIKKFYIKSGNTPLKTHDAIEQMNEEVRKYQEKLKKEKEEKNGK
jgi:DNA-binding Lrp family transcriptional regulator